MFDLIAAVSSSIVAIIAIVGAIYGYKQVKEARKARLLGPFFEMDRRLHEQREERGKLYASYGKQQNTNEWQKLFEKVAVNFDVLGALVREDMIYKPIVFKIYYDVIIKTWDVVMAHIETEVNRGSKAKSYMADFRFLYNEAEAYVSKNGLERPRVFV